MKVATKKKARSRVGTFEDWRLLSSKQLGRL